MRLNLENSGIPKKPGSYYHVAKCSKFKCAPNHLFCTTSGCWCLFFNAILPPETSLCRGNKCIYLHETVKDRARRDTVRIELENHPERREALPVRAFVHLRLFEYLAWPPTPKTTKLARVFSPHKSNPLTPPWCLAIEKRRGPQPDILPP